MQRVDLSARYVTTLMRSDTRLNRPALSGKFTLVFPAAYKLSRSAPAGRVPGEIKRSSDRRGGRWSWTLKLAQKRS